MHERISVNNLCFPGTSAVEIERYWSKLGVRRISLLGHQLLSDDADGAAVRRILSNGDYRVETIAHVFHAGALAQTEMAGARERLNRLIDMAADIDARSIYLLTGGRGNNDWQTAATVFSDELSPCLERASAAGIDLLVENGTFLYSDIHFSHSFRDTITLARKAGTGICMDIYGCWTEEDIHGLIDRATPQVKLVQISDYVLGDRALPARAVPGDGVIPIRALIRQILDTGYQGTFDLELMGPRIDREGHYQAVERAATYLSGILREYCP